MSTPRTGDTVRVHYTGRLADGSVFDSSREREPLEFRIGAAQVIPGFEAAIASMSISETRTIEIPSVEAYGPYDDERRFEVERAQLPDDLDPGTGDRLQLRGSDGGIAVVTVVETSDETITLDGNHPLAGKDLTFEIELVEVVSAAEELADESEAEPVEDDETEE